MNGCDMSEVMRQCERSAYLWEVEKNAIILTPIFMSMMGWTGFEVRI